MHPTTIDKEVVVATIFNSNSNSANALDVTFTPKDVYRRLIETQFRSFLYLSWRSGTSKFDELDKKFKNSYFAEESSIQLGDIEGGDILLDFILSEASQSSGSSRSENTQHTCHLRLYKLYHLIQHLENDHGRKQRQFDGEVFHFILNIIYAVRRSYSLFRDQDNGLDAKLADVAGKSDYRKNVGNGKELKEFKK
ncbi:1744_t:CDS:2 [Ambispora gerdemannii]|uniref:1744_t:CDS:1 n=1 Tax=Ambispora gerdemannii TaxID=144530 RepID=A0A9N9AWU3_9GLOM|nr:1744_t:CDS:2 [Ambispora gerdemannii]